MCFSTFTQSIWIDQEKEQEKGEAQCQSAGLKASIHYATFFQLAMFSCRNKPVNYLYYLQRSLTSKPTKSVFINISETRSTWSKFRNNWPVNHLYYLLSSFTSKLTKSKFRKFSENSDQLIVSLELIGLLVRSSSSRFF